MLGLPPPRRADEAAASRRVLAELRAGVGLVMFGASQGKSVQLPIRGEDRAGMFKRAWSRLAEMF